MKFGAVYDIPNLVQCSVDELVLSFTMRVNLLTAYLPQTIFEFTEHFEHEMEKLGTHGSICFFYN